MHMMWIESAISSRPEFQKHLKSLSSKTNLDFAFYDLPDDKIAVDDAGGWLSIMLDSCENGNPRELESLLDGYCHLGVNKDGEFTTYYPGIAQLKPSLIAELLQNVDSRLTELNRQNESAKSSVLKTPAEKYHIKQQFEICKKIKAAILEADIFVPPTSNTAQLTANDIVGHLDFHPTPEKVIRVLFEDEIEKKYGGFSGAYWEPAEGDGRIVRIAKEYGIDIIGSDIQFRTGGSGRIANFLDQSMEVDGIVTAPPFKSRDENGKAIDELADRFVLHAFRLARRKVAMFLPARYYNTKKRNGASGVFAAHKPTRIIEGNPVSYEGKDRKLHAQDYRWYIWDKINPEAYHQSGGKW